MMAAYANATQDERRQLRDSALIAAGGVHQVCSEAILRAVNAGIDNGEGTQIARAIAVAGVAVTRPVFSPDVEQPDMRALLSGVERSWNLMRRWLDRVGRLVPAVH